MGLEERDKSYIQTSTDCTDFPLRESEERGRADDGDEREVGDHRLSPPDPRNVFPTLLVCVPLLFPLGRMTLPECFVVGVC